MARLVAVCRDGEEDYPFLARQIPLCIDDSLSMIMEFPDHVASVASNEIYSPNFKQFSKCYSKLTNQDLNIALMVTSREVYSSLSQLVPCVGCRRSVERLFSHLVESGNPALEPLTVKSSGMLSVMEACLSDVKKLYSLFYIHGSKLNDLIDAIPKSKKNKRCQLHSLDTHKPRPLGGSWMDLWELMSQECRDEVVVINSACLLETLETYLCKHRFCTDCKNKVLRAYNILVGDLDSSKEKGYCAALYEGLCCCPNERHVHVYSETDFLAHLLDRAEPEFSGAYELRERHAKTIDIAQEEVLTCVGIHLYERLHKIWQKLRAEEQTWQILFHLGIDALRKSFEVAIEKVEGISRLQQFVEELSEEEKAKELKQEKKRQKKKNRRKNKFEIPEHEAEDKIKPEEVALECVEGGCQCCGSHDEDEKLCEGRSTANDCIAYECPSNIKQDLSMHSNGSDGGYSSSMDSSEIGSREGSDIACSEGICNHDEADGTNINSYSEDKEDGEAHQYIEDCWPHSEEQCQSKKKKRRSKDLCIGQKQKDEVCLTNGSGHTCPTKEIPLCTYNALHLPWTARQKNYRFTIPGEKSCLMELMENVEGTSDEEGLTQDEIQSFLESFKVKNFNRHQYRQGVKDRFANFCRESQLDVLKLHSSGTLPPLQH